MANEQYTPLTIEQCFNNHYVVPEYQREYVWEEENIEQLLYDLIGAYTKDNKKPYFMGMMVVYSGKESTLEIVDGQQRVTTFFLMLCAISHLYKKNNDGAGSVFENKIHNSRLDEDGNAVDAYALELQYEQSSSCLANIYHEKFPNETDMGSYSLSDQRLFKAYLAIKKILKVEFPKFQDLKRFAVYIFNKVQLVQIKTENVADALTIFETINERGVGLNPMDLLKNMIFMNVPQDKFPDLNKEWKKLTSGLEKIKEKPLRFLRYFISARYDVIDPTTNMINGILPEDMIYDWLTKNDSQCNYKAKPFDFVESLIKGVSDYTDFRFPNSNDVGNEYLRNVPRIAGSSYKLYLVLLLAAYNMPQDVLGKFKQILESIIYYTTVCQVKANETEKAFASWCPEIRKITNLDELKEFCNRIIIPQVTKWKVDYHQRFRSLNLNLMQQYRIRYILSRITKYVDDVRGGGTNYADIDSYYDKKNQIEHIMPQTCEDIAAYGLQDDNEFREYVGALGNLTLLERTYNALCKNKSYEKKHPVYSGSSAFYLTRSLPALIPAGVDTAADKMNKRLHSWATWNKTSINERQEMLYQLSELIWSIDKNILTW